MEPKPPDGPALQPAKTLIPVALADWMTAPDNPFFAPIANRLWAAFAGRGIVNRWTTRLSTHHPIPHY